ncbi:MAG: trehalase family glycosidase [Victivallaceae bacterium]|nr:trehalase family glycosidase [Victivallaceae bacterium]
MNDFYNAALDIAERKLFTDPEPTRLASPRIGTGGPFVDIFLWDTAFSSIWARYHADRFPVAASLDNFYTCQSPSGFISRQIRPDGISKWQEESTLGFAPPLLAWAELLLEPFVPGRLGDRYAPLLRQHLYNCAKFRRADGLFYSDCWGCGMDNMPRWDNIDEVTSDGGILFERSAITDPTSKSDGLFEWMKSQKDMPFDWNRQLGWSDTSCQMAFNALNLAKIARKLGKFDDEKKLLAQHAEISGIVNDLCFNDQTGFYSDRLGDHPLNRQTICGFWPLLAQVATPERAERLIENLRDPRKFNRPCGIPTLAADDPDYTPDGGYAKGPAWAHTNYMVLAGLENYGHRELACEFAAKLYNAAEKIWRKTNTIWENYSPEQSETPPDHSSPDFCGWSALIPIAYSREYLNL